MPWSRWWSMPGQGRRSTAPEVPGGSVLCRGGANAVGRRPRAGTEGSSSALRATSRAMEGGTAVSDSSNAFRWASEAPSAVISSYPIRTAPSSTREWRPFQDNPS